MQKSKIFIGIIILFMSSFVLSKDLDNSTLSKLEEMKLVETDTTATIKVAKNLLQDTKQSVTLDIDIDICSINQNLPVCLPLAIKEAEMVMEIK